MRSSPVVDQKPFIFFPFPFQLISSHFAATLYDYYHFILLSIDSLTHPFKRARAWMNSHAVVHSAHTTQQNMIFHIYHQVPLLYGHTYSFNIVGTGTRTGTCAMVWCGEWYKQTIIWVQCVWIARCSTFSDSDDISKLCAFSIHGAERWYVNWMKMCTHHGIQTEQSLIQYAYNHRIWVSWFREKENEEVKTNSSHMKWTETNGYSLLSCSCSIGIHPQSRQRRHTQSIVVNSMRYDEIRFKSNWIFPLGNSLPSSSVGGSCCGEIREEKKPFDAWTTKQTKEKSKNDGAMINSTLTNWHKP